MTAAAFPQPSTATRAATLERVPLGAREWTMLRWAVRATLLLGVAASVAANVLHAQPNPISQAIAAWPPLALLFTVELIARVPVHRRGLAAARLLAATTIAGIAAFVSYWHMAGVAARYGETGASPYLLPLSVDGLIIVASISLVEISGRLHATRPPAEHPAPATRSVLAPATAVAPRADPTRWPAPSTNDAAPGTLQLLVPPEAPAPHTLPVTADEPPVDSGTATGDVVEPTDVVPGPAVRHAEGAVQPLELVPPPAGLSTTMDDSDAALSAQKKPQSEHPADHASAAAQGSSTPAVMPAPEKPHDDADSPHPVPAAPREAIAYWQRRQPGIGIDDLAERLGKSPRQIRRYMRQAAGNAPRRVNGRRNDTLAGTFRSPNP